MRTTLELDDNVIRAAERCASEQGQPLAEFIEDAVRKYLTIADGHGTHSLEDAGDQSQSGDADDVVEALVRRNKGTGRAAAVELAESKLHSNAIANMVDGGRPRPSYAGSIEDDADLSLKVEEVLAASWPKG